MTLNKRIISFLCVVAMVFSMCAVAVSAADPLTVDETVAANWTPLAAKYSKTTNGVIAPKGDNYEIRTTGFDFKADDNGGLKVHTATYKENSGVYSVAAVSSKNKTALDGLTVELTPDDLKMECDSNNASTNISFVISENPITEIATFNADSNSYDGGLYNSVDVMSNGLRELGAYEGKSLTVTISNQKIGNTEDHVATSVAIVYDDGSYVNKNDGHNGFRWVFSARNSSESAVGDASGVSQVYENIDFSKGLKLEVRADETLGYIVNVNGKDYYDATYIGFYPDCSQATFEGKEYNSYALTEDDYNNLTKNYTDSMTYALKDIDLSGLGADFEGYLTVGATGTAITTNNCDFTITKINTHNAATWTGEPACQHLETEVVVKDATCGVDGAKTTKCVACGKTVAKEVIPATGDHTPAAEYVVTLAPTCVAEGTKTLTCTECELVIETAPVAVDPEAHNKTMKDVTAPTCTEAGVKQEACTLCDATFGEPVAVDALGHDDGAWVVTLEPTCTEAGSKDLVCTRCNTEVLATEAIEAAGHDQNSEWTVVDVPTYFEEGVKKQFCSVCNTELAEDVVPVKEYVNPFTDVKESHWFYNSVAYCVKRGYVSGMTPTTFVPTGNITRAQFLVMLAALDGVDLSVYDGKDSGFTDVKPTHWYNKVVCWAVEQDITSGLGEGKFGPGNQITRSQLARFLYVYSEKNGIDVEGRADLNVFPDAGAVQNWAKTPVEWAVSAGLISGVANKDGKTYLTPNGTATRAQATVMFKAYDDFRGLNSTDAE